MSDLTILDRIERDIRSNDLSGAYELLFDHLEESRRALSQLEWKRYVGAFQEHPLHRLLCECPFNRRAFQKPRGYPGDAVVLDYIYGCEALRPDTSPLGEQMFRLNIETQACRSVRARRDILAGIIDSVAESRAQPAILSFACGHLREAERSQAVTARRIGSFYGLDQDPETLNVLARNLLARGIQPVRASVRSVLSGKNRYDRLDLIYSAGLYDYLADRVAADFTRVLFGMLRPGGRLLIANFAPNLSDIAFMEASMDWWLTYRDERACEGLLADLHQPHSHRAFRDPHLNIVFLEITKEP